MNESIYTRTEMLIGAKKLQKLKNAHIVIVGVGGVGSFIAESLTRSGVGTLTLIDMDDIAASNLNRQIHALTSTMGKSKVEVLSQRLKDINPKIQITAIQQILKRDNIATLIGSEIDYVADAIDMVTAKLDLISYCIEQQIPIISSMGTGNKLNPQHLELTDIYKTHTDPLAKVMRRELRARGIKKLDVVYSSEESIKPLDKDGTPLRTPASMPFVPASAGLLIGSAITRYIIDESC